MSIVVSTPTGHIGSALTGHLLQAGVEPVLLARDPGKVATFVEKGALAKRGSLDDAAFVVEATVDCETLFWLTPPDFSGDDMRGRQNAFGKAAAKAVDVNRIPRVVNLSSVGAQHGEGVGPVNGLHDVEQKLNEVCRHVTHLRPAFFMENYLGYVGTIASDGAVYLPVSGDTRIPMVATRDIAKVAAQRILDDSWEGLNYRGIHGPADLSFDEAAATLGEVLGKTVKHVEVPPEAAIDAMTSMGLPPRTSALFVQMLQAMNSGHMAREEKRTPETTTPTTFRQFCEDTLAPAVEAASK